MSYQTEILADTPTVFYMLEEASGTTASDSSGNGLNATYTGSGVTYETPGPLIPEDTDGVVLNGTTGRARLLLGLTGTNRPSYPFVIELWAKPTPSPARSSDWTLNIYAADSSAYVGLGVGNLGIWDAEIGEGAETSTMLGPVATGGWDHIVMRVLGDTERYFYVNGVLVASSTSSVSWLGTGGVGSAFSIAVGSDGGGFYFDGSLWGVAYYNHDLTPARIAEHYALAAYDEPITEKIELRAKARIATITEANGYTFDATAQREDPQRGQSPVDKLLVVSADDESRDEPEVYGSATWLKPMTVTCYAVEADGSSTNLRARANRMASDVYKAVMTDPFWDDGTGTGTCLALNTFIRPPSSVPPPEGGVYAIQANFDIQYRTDENDPYSAT